MEKNVFSCVNYLVVALMAVVMNFVLTGCSDTYENEEQVQVNKELMKSTPAVQPAQPKVNFTFMRIDSVCSGKEFNTSWYAEETTTSTKVRGELSVAASHEHDGNAVSEAEMSKVIDVEYARKHTTFGELKSNLADYGYDKQWHHAMRIVAQLGDGGTVCMLDMSNVINKVIIRDTLRNAPADSIMFGKAQVKSLRFVEKGTTRAAETYVDKNDPRQVEVTWSVPVTRVHDKVASTYYVEVRDTIVVYPIKKNDIDKVETDTLRQMVDPTIFNCIVRHKLTYKNGESGKAEKSATIKCSLSVKPEWEETVSNTAFSFLKREDVVKGSAYSLGERDGVKTLEREDIFTTVQSNGTEEIRTPYTFKHQSVTITDDFGTYTFNFVDPDFRQVSTKVEKVNETNTLETARLRNTIEVLYLGGKQTGEETVLLKRSIAEYLVSDVLDTNSAKKVTLDNKTQYMIDRLKKYSTGREVRETSIFEVGRSAKVGDPWSVVELNTNHQTGDYGFNTINSDKVSKTINDVVFTAYVREKKGTAEVKLNGSTQKNVIFVTESEDCVATYNGQTYKFDDNEVSVKHSDTVTGGAEMDGFKVYNYADAVKYTVNGNTKNLTPTGTIKVKVEEEFSFPAYLGDVLLARQTTTMNENRDGYIYVVSIQFTSGYVVPGIVRLGSNKVEWMLDKAELVTGTNKYNSVVYTSDKGWINCTAHDVYTQNYLIWYRGSVEELNRVTFDQARAFNWDGGYMKDGHWTVYTNHFLLEVAKGKVYVTERASGSRLKFVKF